MFIYQPKAHFPGNSTLWLKKFGRYDRKSTESSNSTVHLPSNAAPELYSGFGYL